MSHRCTGGSLCWSDPNFWFCNGLGVISHANLGGAGYISGAEEMARSSLKSQPEVYRKGQDVLDRSPRAGSPLGRILWHREISWTGWVTDGNLNGSRKKAEPPKWEWFTLHAERMCQAKSILLKSSKKEMSWKVGGKKITASSSWKVKP